MNRRIVEAFEAVTMPEESARKIRAAAAAKSSSRKAPARRLGTMAAAMAAAVLMLLAVSPQVRAAVSDWVVRYVFPESGITIYEETNASGEVGKIMAVDTECPAFAEVRDGRLYFTGNGKNMDITDIITPEQPYFYSYVDAEYGLTHYMVVGYSDSLENFGIYEFLREEKEGQQPWEGWSNGYGRNFLDPDTQTRYPWVDIVWETLDIPWPKPGA